MSTLLTCFHARDSGDAGQGLDALQSSLNVTNHRLHSRSRVRRPQTHYEVLGIPVHASKEEIREAFFKLSKEVHPDRDPNNPALHAQFVQLNEAHSVLSHIKRRRLYDLNINAFPTSPQRNSETWTTRVHVSKYKTTTHSEQEWREQAWQEEMRYWEHLRQARKGEQRNNRAGQIVGGCIFIMAVSMLLQYLGFRKLQEVNQRYISEQNKEAHQFNMETQQRIREHGLEGQLAILRKRHREFAAKQKAYSQNQDP
uniref:dnaJ homolog subfamily C member 4-like n=1 Tax=Myxine glutinosa TaxID=7769 RepID=UPI00358F89B0